MESQPRRVLVVDDNVDAVDSLVELLQMHGHIVTGAYNGGDAISTAIEFKPDVVILDLGMPQPDGFQVATILRQHEATQNVVVIAFSVWGSADARDRTRSCGFDLHLTKPSSFDHIHKAVVATQRIT